MKVDEHIDGLPIKGEYLVYVGPFVLGMTKGKDYKVMSTAYKVSCGFQVEIYDDCNYPVYVFLNYFDWTK